MLVHGFQSSEQSLKERCLSAAPHQGLFGQSEWSTIHEYFRYELRLFPIPDCSKGLTQDRTPDQAGTVQVQRTGYGTLQCTPNIPESHATYLPWNDLEGNPVIPR